MNKQVTMVAERNHTIAPCGVMLVVDPAMKLRQQYLGLAMIVLSTNPAVDREVGRTARGNLFVVGFVKPFAIDQLRAVLTLP
jgi:hypothetical protein